MLDTAATLYPWPRGTWRKYSVLIGRHAGLRESWPSAVDPLANSIEQMLSVWSRTMAVLALNTVLAVVVV